jgi:hypothetical protein
VRGVGSGSFAAGAEQVRRASAAGLFTDIRHIGKTIRFMSYACKPQNGLPAIL